LQGYVGAAAVNIWQISGNISVAQGDSFAKSADILPEKTEYNKRKYKNLSGEARL
jgi:hypothetical protein